MFVLNAFRSKRKLYASILDGIQADLCVGLVQSQVDRVAILAGEAPPSHWTSAAEEHLPNDPGHRRRVSAFIEMFARRLAANLSRSTVERDFLNDQIAQAKGDQCTGESLLLSTREGVQERRALLDTAGALGEQRAKLMILLERRTYHSVRIPCWYAAAAVALGAEAVTIASATFQLLPDADTTQQIGTWTVAISAATTMAFLVERSIRPLFDSSQDPASDGAHRRVVTLAVLLTGLLTCAIAAIRVVGIGEGGASDLAHFALGVLVTPFFALIAGSCAGVGRQHHETAGSVQEQIYAARQAEFTLAARIKDLEADATDRAVRRADGYQLTSLARAAETEAVRSRQALLQEVCRGVLESPDIIHLAAALATEAAELSRRKPGITPARKWAWTVPLGWFRTLMVLVVLPFLNGCSPAPGNAFGQGNTATGVVVFVDPSSSVTDRETFRTEARVEFAQFLKRASSGSHFELWVTAATPGVPRLCYQITIPKILPRERADLRRTSQARFENALRGLFPERPVPWSSVLEDSHRCGERLSGLPLGRRRLVILSDLLQYSPTLKSSRILGESNPSSLVERVVQDYPRFNRPPDEARLIRMPGRVGKAGVLSPGKSQRVQQFWRQLYAAWGVPATEIAEPSAIDQTASANEQH